MDYGRRYFVYMVLCRDRTFYTGITHDVDVRVGQHNAGVYPDCYTYTRRPVRLVFSTDFKEVLDAIAFEKQLKGWSRAKKIALVRGDWPEIVRLARE
jgi:putative endonuclease